MQKKTKLSNFLSNPQASNTGPRGNADSKLRLIVSHQFFKVYKAKWIKKNNQNTNKTVLGSKTKVPSQQVQKQVIKMKNRRSFFYKFSPKAMRSSQAFIHARMRSCNTHHLHVWEHVQVREPHICFRKSHHVFQGGAHILCKINESSNNVGRATVFDTKKRCDE